MVRFLGRAPSLYTVEWYLLEWAKSVFDILGHWFKCSYSGLGTGMYVHGLTLTYQIGGFRLGYVSEIGGCNSRAYMQGGGFCV